MGQEKKRVRENFREAVFQRDGFRCAVCGKSQKEAGHLDAHHITDRNEMPEGGYVAENGIALCPVCHEKAEVWHSSGHTRAEEGYLPDDLYRRIGSSLEKARKACLRLR